MVLLALPIDDRTLLASAGCARPIRATVSMIAKHFIMLFVAFVDSVVAAAAAVVVDGNGRLMVNVVRSKFMFVFLSMCVCVCVCVCVCGNVEHELACCCVLLVLLFGGICDAKRCVLRVMRLPSTSSPRVPLVVLLLCNNPFHSCLVHVSMKMG